MHTANRASVEFKIEWQSNVARHSDIYLAEKVDFWRDIFPDDFEQALKSMEIDETYSETFPAGELMETSFDKGQVKSFPLKFFNNQSGVEPQVGRFYPKSFAWQGLDCYKGDYHPFRIINIKDGKITADANHPLATYPITLTARKTVILGPIEERGGVCNHIGELITEKGPGMQVPYQAYQHELGNVSDKTVNSAFLDHYPFSRMDENADSLFYSLPRMTQHIDSLASQQIKNLYQDLIVPDSNITLLDLMSSIESHLPDSFSPCNIIGLGMNEEELKANPMLKEHVVHDLNTSPILPFADNSMDHVICNLSIEYLTDPLAVIKETSRVLKPGGKFITTFSERWFPPKAITLWTQIHPFERLQLVLDYYLHDALFAGLNTFSIRGLPRPEDDKYSAQMQHSDPIFAVWGTLRS